MPRPKRVPSPEEQAAIDLLEANGWSVLRTGSYTRLHERVRVAEALRDAARDDADSARRWARDCLEAERRLSNRIEATIGFAFEHGATVEDLMAFNDRLATAER